MKVKAQCEAMEEVEREVVMRRVQESMKNRVERLRKKHVRAKMHAPDARVRH